MKQIALHPAQKVLARLYTAFMHVDSWAGTRSVGPTLHRSPGNSTQLACKQHAAAEGATLQPHPAACIAQVGLLEEAEAIQECSSTDHKQQPQQTAEGACIMQPSREMAQHITAHGMIITADVPDCLPCDVSKL